ncbi:MAG: nitroreductase [Cyclobacteriaceae bacterium]|nr:nitroreductase [Cyclobacteriaceae bacterium]MDW8330400.1 nitroreductase [Cyclobacteriaceae bacterium]
MGTAYFNTIILQRKSTYPAQYSGEPVPDEIVHQILENANRAPTHKRTEPWRFMVFCGEGRRKLAETQAAVYKSVTTADGTFKEERYRNLLTKPLESSHIILVYMKRDPKKSVPEVEEIGAVFCAIENMYLTAAAYGVGCYLSTGGITYFEEAKNAFSLEPDDRIIGFFHLGMPKGETPVSERKPVADKTIWITK